jgi:transcriptional regulator with XRE-family HTH domain
MSGPVHDLTTFGGLLADLRERRGLSQADLAAATTCPWIEDVENGRYRPSREFVERVAATLALDADDTGRLYVAAGLLPPGTWVYCDGWVIRPASDMPGKEETTNAI